MSSSTEHSKLPERTPDGERHRRPNLFIVGAPKSGTTALHRYLSQHSVVYMSPEKEPCYFGSDFESPYYPQSLHAYLDIFDGAGDERWVGEATTTYLRSTRAAQEIAKFDRDARIIAMLRNPVDMIYSLHSQRCYEGVEPEHSFERALELEPERRAGRSLPKKLLLPREYHIYTHFGYYREQLERFLSAFNPSQVHIVIYDDFREDPRAVYASVCRFLGILPDPDLDPEVVNANKRHRMPRLAALLRGEISLVRRAGKALVPKRPRDAMLRALRSWNTVKRPREPMRPELRRRLTSLFADDVSWLAAHLDRSLDGWGNAGAPGARGGAT